MSTVGLTKAMREALERVNQDAADITPAMRAKLHERGLVYFIGHCTLLSTRGHAALAAPRMTKAEFDLLAYLEEGIGTPPRYSVWLSCERNEWIEFNNGYECWDFTPAGRTALNNVRAAMGSPDYKEGL